MRPKHIQLLGIAAGQGAGRYGAQDGPGALRAAGLVGVLAAAGHRVEDLGDVPGIYQPVAAQAGISINRLPDVLRVNQHSHDCVVSSRRRDPGAFLLIVGGDHSLAIGTLAGLADTCKRLGLLWIDAHGDFNTPRSSPSGNAHGMSLATACGHGFLELKQIAAREPMVRPEDVFLLGVRDLDRVEREALEASPVNLDDMPTWRERGLLPRLNAALDALGSRCDHIHLSFDIDVLDPPLVPGTGTPVAGGLTMAEALEVLQTLSARDQLASAEFVEYNPRLDRDGQTAQRVRELITCFHATTPRGKTV